MELLTPLETICRLILRAKEMEAQVPAQDPDDDPADVDDYDDEGGQALSVLEDELNDVEEEVQAVLDDLAEVHHGHPIGEVVALAWIGRGTYDSSEWDEAYAEANDLSGDERIQELLDMPLLGGHLEAGLAAFDYSCDGVGQVD